MELRFLKNDKNFILQGYAGLRPGKQKMLQNEKLATACMKDWYVSTSLSDFQREIIQSKEKAQMQLEMLKIGKTRLLVSNTQMVSKGMNGFRGPFINDVILKSGDFLPLLSFLFLGFTYVKPKPNLSQNIDLMLNLLFQHSNGLD